MGAKGRETLGSLGGGASMSTAGGDESQLPPVKGRVTDLSFVNLTRRRREMVRRRRRAWESVPIDVMLG